MTNKINYGKTVQGMMTPPQSRPGFGREKEMVKNNAGGYTFTVDKWTHLNRFLILGTEDNTYYVTAKDLTEQNAKNVLSCIKEDGIRAVNECVRVSDQGLAAKNDPAIFVLALCASHGDEKTKAYAFKNLNKVCRIATHLMLFANYCDSMRGWGRGMRNGIAGWYNDMPLDKLAYQVAKYGSRNEWSHRDLLRKSHPVTNEQDRNDLYKYITQGELPTENDSLAIIGAMERVKAGVTPGEAINLITDYGLTFEMLPTELLNDIGVWEALLQRMPVTATIRNLPKMTSIGLVAPNSLATKTVFDRLTNETILQKGRVHPLNVLIAYKTYSQGRGDKGSLTWLPVAKVKTALNDAFMKSFKYQEPTDKRFSVNFDVSGSMWGSRCAGLASFSAAEAVSALGLCLVGVEPNCETYAFYDKYISLAFPRQSSIDTALSAIKSTYAFGRTDCALPTEVALKNKIPFDVFVIYTDNETWYGNIHPYQSLRNYRQAMGIDAKMIVCATTSTYYSIADPQDKGMMDIVGFDASLPKLVADFAIGNI